MDFPRPVDGRKCYTPPNRSPPLAKNRMSESFTPAQQLPPGLATGLQQLRRRWRWLTVLHGSGLFGLVATAVLGLGLVVDLLCPLPLALRMLLLVLVVGVTVWAFCRLVVGRILARISPAELAALVERVHPELEERLTSSVELLESGSDQPSAAPLCALLVEETEIATRSINMGGVIQLRAAGVMLGWALLAVSLLLGPLAMPGSGYSLFLTRFFLPWSNLERAVLYRITVEDGDRVVARGSDVRIQVQVTSPTHSKPTAARVLPEELWCHWTTRSGAVDRRLLERTADGAAFTTTWPEVLEGFHFEVASGVNRSRRHEVRVVDPPALRGLVLEITPPGYTGRKPRTTDAVVGEVSVLGGSRLHWRMQFNKPLKTARLRLGAVDGERSWPALLADDGRSANVDFAASEGGPLLVALTDRDGLTRDDDTYRQLVVTGDAAPILRLDGHDRPRAVRPGDVLAVRAEATDDFGLAALELHLQINPRTQDVQAVDQNRLGGRHVVEHFTLDLSKLQLKHGDRLTYRVRAVDNRPSPVANETWSTPRTLLIDRAARPPGAADIAQRQAKLKAQIEQARRDAVAGRSTLVELRQQVLAALKNQTPFPANDAIRKAGAGQRELAGRVDGIARQLGAHPLFRSIAPLARDVARTILPTATRRLEPALEAPLADKATRLAQSGEDLSQVVTSLTRLGTAFDKLAALERELMQLDRLARQTKRLADDVDTLARMAGDSPPGETADTRAQRREDFTQRKQELSARQKELAGDLDNLLERRPEVVEAARQDQLALLRELARRALELARPQEELGQALNEEAALPNSKPPVIDRPAVDPSATVLGRQQELARQAARQALDVAGQTGTEAPAAREAARYARQAGEAAQQILGGRFTPATTASTSARAQAKRAASTLAETTEPQPDPALVRRAEALAGQQVAETARLLTLKNSATARRDARGESQRVIAVATEALGSGLDDAARRLGRSPLDLPQAAQQATRASQVAQTGRKLMTGVRENVAASRHAAAASGAKRASESLKLTAKLALGAGDPKDRPETPVPGEVGKQVASASDQLEQARQGLAQAKFDDRQTASSRRPGNQSQGKKGSGKGKKGSGKGKSQQKGQGKSPGQQAGKQPGQDAGQGPLSRTASQLRRAARSLARASRKLQPGQPQDNNSVAPPGQDDPTSRDTKGNTGTGSSVPMELKRLEAQLQRLSGRAWGRLPGSLKTEILQAARRDPNGDYAKLIRFYFEEIARDGRGDLSP